MDGSDEPVYAVTIRVRVSYGFLGVRRVDLEIGTNGEGKARFVGLPRMRIEFCIFAQAKAG
jgi:hypothetical protein